MFKNLIRQIKMESVAICGGFKDASGVSCVSVLLNFFPKCFYSPHNSMLIEVRYFISNNVFFAWAMLMIVLIQAALLSQSQRQHTNSVFSMKLFSGVTASEVLSKNYYIVLIAFKKQDLLEIKHRYKMKCKLQNKLIFG